MAHIERPHSLRETAARWFERAGNDDTSAETRGALNTWLNESPEHAADYHSIELTWLQLKSAAEDPAILEFRQDAARRLQMASTTRRSIRWAAVALIVVFLCAALWIVVARTGLEISPLAWFKGQNSKPAT
jgi:ferric-dicitrate binding protein FerR (iron transport regulator)